MMATAEKSLGHSLSGLLEGMVKIAPSEDRQVTCLSLDSRQVGPGTLFLACAGGRHHGLAFARQAQEQGAVAILWEPDGAEGDRLVMTLRGLGIPLLSLPDLGNRASEIAARFYADPSRQLRIYGITGTNGKTSISQLLAQALEDEAPCGIMGTLGYGFSQSLQSTGYTTPDAVTLQRLLAALRQQGAESVTMEVSSHALDQGRAAAVHFDTAIFTNLSRDHFDYHGSFEHYAAAKQRLFQTTGLRNAVINLDDEMGGRLLNELGEDVEALAYTLDATRHMPEGLAGWARATRITPSPDGMEIQLVTHQGEGLLKSRLLGRFNAANLLAVLLVLLQRGWDLPRVLQVMQGLTTVPGRMQLFGGDGKPSVVVDYAHTPDALEKALLAARVHCAGRLVVVFGCGGDRDRGKRPLMGSLAESHADEVYVTDDNPRSEPSAEIIAEIIKGMREPTTARVVADRGRAIREAIQQANPGDLVLVAGKGHEDYQLVGDLSLHFDDRQQVAEALTLWQGTGR
jgi:UDP-N-acetylmuramoyl-L-alanyl-D-glutamate--2,6-diaminopimelate ligase